MGWSTEEQRFDSGRARDYFPIHSADRGSGIHPYLLFNGYWGLFPGLKEAGA
jgi:hypothetical protein